MKKILTLIILTFTLLGCKNNSNKINQSNDLEEAIAKAETSERVETKLFLGFELGMTEEEVKNHLKKLEEEGKVYTTNKYTHNCDVISQENTYRLDFIFDYDNGKLYKITLPFENTTLSRWERTDFYTLSRLFNSTDREGFKEYREGGDNDKFGRIIFIKGNLIVIFENTLNTIQYIDAPTVRKRREQEEKKEQDKRDKSPSYF